MQIELNGIKCNKVGVILVYLIIIFKVQNSNEANDLKISVYP